MNSSREIGHCEIIKIIAGPSRHYRQLKSNELKYQKSKPFTPIWRIIIADPYERRYHLRLFTNPPEGPEAEKVITNVLSTSRDTNVAIPETLEKMCPGLRQRIQALGHCTYRPSHGFAAGSNLSAREVNFLSSLMLQLRKCRESMASVDEITGAANGPAGVITWDINPVDPLSQNSDYKVAQVLAQKITRMRGRNPEIGEHVRRRETAWAPLNKGSKLPPQDNILKTLMERASRGSLVWEIANYLKQLEIAPGEEDKEQLLWEIGVTVIYHQFSALKDGHDNLLRWLSFDFKRYWQHVRTGIQEALKGPVPMGGNTFLHAGAAPVNITYGNNCDGLVLRGVPAHHHIQTMLGNTEYFTPTILASPFFVDPAEEIPHFLTDRSMRPAIWHAGRTPLNPKQCFVKGAREALFQHGLLAVVSLLPTSDPSSFRAFEDRTIQPQINKLVNERLSRTGKNVFCDIGAFQPYGRLMEIPVSPSWEKYF